MLVGEAVVVVTGSDVFKRKLGDGSGEPGSEKVHVVVGSKLGQNATSKSVVVAKQPQRCNECPMSQMSYPFVTFVSSY